MRDIHVLILSGGASKRMGFAKANFLLPSGQTLLATHLQTLKEAGLDNVSVVVGPCSAEIQKQHPHLPVSWIANDHWELGPFSSLQAGLQSLPNSLPWVLVLPVDTGPLSVQTILKLKESINSTTQVLIPLCQGKRGHPVLLSPTFVSHLQNLNLQDSTSRLDCQIDFLSEIGEVEVQDSGVLQNRNQIDS